jgi:hypothetical protein
MTRRGSLAYYLTAWVCGCVFMSFAVWLVRDWETKHLASFSNVAGFLVFCFFGLLFGAFAALLFGWLLRRVAAILGARLFWQWLLIGAVLAELVILGLATLNRFATVDPGTIDTLPLISIVVGGPWAVYAISVWLPIPVGAATGSVLFLVYRAFDLPLGNDRPAM